MESIWSKQTQFQKHEELKEDITASVAIIGAGISGILTAYFLQKQGIDCVLLERGQVCGGQTKNTTAKITVQHADIYHKLIKTVGIEKAKEYYFYNKRAIDDFKRVIDEENIDCDFQVLPSVLYSTENKQLIEDEAKAAKSLGIDCEIKYDSELPFEIASSLVFQNQAQFDPLKFLKPISEKLKIYENTNVLKIENNTLITEHARVRADKLVFSSHYPFVNFPGLYFIKMHQERSYVIVLEKAQKLSAMYYGADPGGLSLRCADDKLLLGGSAHRCGKNTDGGKYDALEKEAAKLWKNSKVTAKWSAQDCITGDGIPYIGRFSRGIENWFIQTGYNKWGMTSSMAAARLTAQSIERKDELITVFSPSRKLNLPIVKQVLTETGEAIKGLSQKFCFSCFEKDELQNGEAAVCDIDGEKTGVYKDENGKFHMVSVRCPHLGCELKWNPDEKSWDCPCHGSRFTFDGKLICEPSQTDLDGGTSE